MDVLLYHVQQITCDMSLRVQRSGTFAFDFCLTGHDIKPEEPHRTKAVH
jgi:hypothetical protein